MTLHAAKILSQDAGFESKGDGLACECVEMGVDGPCVRLTLKLTPEERITLRGAEGNDGNARPRRGEIGPDDAGEAIEIRAPAPPLARASDGLLDHLAIVGVHRAAAVDVCPVHWQRRDEMANRRRRATRFPSPPPRRNAATTARRPPAMWPAC